MLDRLLPRPGSTPAALLNALDRRLGAAGHTPDVLTYAALACGVGAGALFWLDHGWLALLALAVSGLLDALDGRVARLGPGPTRSEEHTSELQSPCNLVCRLLLEKKKAEPMSAHPHAPRKRRAAMTREDVCDQGHRCTQRHEDFSTVQQTAVSVRAHSAYPVRGAA